MQKRLFLSSLAVAAAICSTPTMAQDKFKIGLILPMTGHLRRQESKSKRQSNFTWLKTAIWWLEKRLS